MNRNRRRAYRRLLQNALREARIQAGLRQEEVARRLEQPQSFVSKYETGERRLDPAELKEICEVLEVSLIEMIQKMEDSTL